MIDLSTLPRLRPGVQRRRASTWDRTGGNTDSVTVLPGANHTLAADDGPGRITHLWATILTPDLYWGRNLVLRMYWDGNEHPSVEVPFGDFFGVGNCLTATFSSAVLEISPRNAMSFHCWFPMPFASGFRITVENEGPLPLLALYSYVDYERWPAAEPDAGRFCASWTRRRGPGLATPPTGTYEPGSNLSGDDNYVVLATEGQGHYVGCTLNVHSDDGGWYGEGDDMIFVDSDAWPPALHGTGTEDYFGTAWSPSTPFSSLYHGQPVADRDDWTGFSSVYRFHLADPVMFEQSLRVTLEQGHANDRRDDYSSVAYWYQRDHSAPFATLPPPADRLPPWPAAWRRRADAVASVFGAAFVDPAIVDDADQRGRFLAGVVQVMRLAHERDWAGIDAVLAWLVDDPDPGRPVATAEAGLTSELAGSVGLADDALSAVIDRLGITAVVEDVLGRWARAIDTAEVDDPQFVIGVVVQHGGEHHAWQVVARSGETSIRPGREGHERLTFISDALALVRFTNGDLDPWEAVLRGRIRVRGDSSLALRLHALLFADQTEGRTT